MKAWYQFDERCSRCNSDATIIPIPNNWMTYVTYGFYVLVPALVALYMTYEDELLLWVAVAGLVVLFVVAYADLARGSKYAKSKIKVANSDASEFRRKGWS